jgi:hypothetical protein
VSRARSGLWGARVATSSPTRQQGVQKSSSKSAPVAPQIGPFQPATRGVRELHVLKCCREDFAKPPKPTPAKFEGSTTMIARLHAKNEIGDRGSD